MLGKCYRHRLLYNICIVFFVPRNRIFFLKPLRGFVRESSANLHERCGAAAAAVQHAMVFELNEGQPSPQVARAVGREHAMHLKAER